VPFIAKPALPAKSASTRLLRLEARPCPVWPDMWTNGC